MQFNGQVNTINSKYFPAGNGKKAATLWSFALKGQDGFFGCGYTKPDFEKGDVITFEATEVNGRMKADLSSVKRESSAIETSVPNTTSSGTGYAAKEDAKQKYIAWQAARKDALEFTNLTRELGLLPKLPANPGKAAEALVALVEEYTLRFYQDTYAAPEREVSREVETKPAVEHDEERE